VSGRLPAEVWEITREEWRGRRGPSTGINRLQEGDPT
jgi:hypothetical protein